MYLCGKRYAMSYNNLIGLRFGKLVVIERAGSTKENGLSRRLWRCKCDCGNIHISTTNTLTRGITKSCGCYQSEIASKTAIKNNTIHNLTKENKRLYNIWKAMRQRCNNTNSPEYNSYGGRGISICNEWSSPVVFCDWAKNNGYDDNLTIDRIDNNKNYEPNNCQWITLTANIEKKGVFITVNDICLSLNMFSRRFGYNNSYFSKMLRIHGIERVESRIKQLLFIESNKKGYV